MRHDIELTIPATIIKGHIPADLPLSDRASFAMRYVRSHEHDLFWMTGNLDDDLRIRAALAGVLLAGNDEDKEAIERSLKPLRMLSAAMEGIPVDFSGIDLEGVLPIMKLWNATK